MDDPVISPGERGETPDTNPVPAIGSDPITASLSSLKLPSIEPLGTDTVTVEGVVDVFLVRGVRDAALDALAALAAHEFRVAAVKARLVERVFTASHVEAAALGMGRWQENDEEQSAVSEIAAILCLPEGSATALVHQSVSLVREQHRTLGQLGEGVFSWGHATTVVEEILSLQGTTRVPQAVVEGFEQALLEKAPGTTLRTFQDRARKLRERAHPESIVTRAKRAHEKRRMELAPDRDGMSWLSLHLPAASAQGIWNTCTRLARACQGPTEARTLTQLRLDIAVTYLLGQTPHLPTSVGTVNGAGMTVEELAATATADYTPGWIPTTDGSNNNNGRNHNNGSNSNEGAEAVIAGSLPQGASTGGTVGEPSPSAQVLVLVPFLSAFGITDEPAELEGHGPIPASVARKLLGESKTFLRVLTDPVTGEFLDLAPDTYRVRKKERLVLRARDKTCSFTNCRTVTADTDLDHMKAWAEGGKSTARNTRHHCPKHHLLKHHQDDKNRDGTPAYRPPGRDRHTGKPVPPERIRGWHVTTDENGFTGWTSPAGRHYPAPPPDTAPPEYPDWLTELITQRTDNHDDVTDDDRGTGSGQQDASLGAAQAPDPAVQIDYYSPLERIITYRKKPRH